MEKEIKVLDHGYVKYIEHMGSDDKVAWAARRSVQDPKKKKRPDEHLIDYLVREGHHSPLEHSLITFELKMPLFVARQMMRKRTGKFSELSLRYSSPEELDFYRPDESRVRIASLLNFEEEGEQWEDFVFEGDEIVEDAMKVYRGAQDFHKWPSELARIYLPQNMYTNVAMTLDLRNLLHLLNERLAQGAQYEIRVFAEAMLSIVEELFPITVTAWKEHVINAITFSKKEFDIILNVCDFSMVVEQLGFVDERKARILRDKLFKHVDRVD